MGFIRKRKAQKDLDKAEDPNYETPGYPDGGPFTGESLYDYHRRKWDELDGEIKRRAVRFLQKELSPDNQKEWFGEMEKDPEHWCSQHHMFAGMAFRNLLRQEVKDSELPTGNWDDYYVAALEAAVGAYA